MTRTLLWPTVAAAIALAILVSLGLWQLQRLAWKEDLIARIDARSKAQAISLDQAIKRQQDDEGIEFFPIRLEGIFDHTNERHLYTVESGKAGWRIFTPLRTSGGHLVMIDRGFVPETLKEPESRKVGLVQGKVDVEGQIRLPEIQGVFTPDNEPQNNAWFWRDIAAMARGANPESAHRVLFYIEDGNANTPGGWPRGALRDSNLPNRHLEYALTWFGLALALIGVYAAFVRSAVTKQKFT